MSQTGKAPLTQLRDFGLEGYLAFDRRIQPLDGPGDEPSLLGDEIAVHQTVDDRSGDLRL